MREQADVKILKPGIFAGLRDTLKVLQERIPENPLLAELDTALAQGPAGLRPAFALLASAASQSARIAAALANEEQETSRWAEILKRDCEAHFAELNFLAPWLALPDATQNRWRDPVSDSGTAATKRSPPASRSPPEPVRARWEEEFSRLEETCTLRELSRLGQAPDPLVDGQDELSGCLTRSGENARQRLLALETLAKQCDDLAAMDFAFLFNPARDLFSTGFNVTEQRFDSGYYDLLASEARLCSYVAIALGQISQDHWFSLGRLLVAAPGGPILVSWSGSMFEYLMPLLVMPNYENTLLDHTCQAAVRLQIGYGKQRGVPWGYPSPATTGPMPTSIINTAPLACPVSG